MRAGRLRHKAMIQEIVNTVDDFGQPISNGSGYQDLKPIWCRINPIRGNEKFLSNQDYSKTTHKIKMRFTEIDASHRIVYQGRVFNIMAIMNINEMDRELEILAWEERNDN